MRFLPPPFRRRIEITEEIALQRHEAHRLRHSVRDSMRDDLLRGARLDPIRWHYIVDEKIRPGVQKPHQDLLIRLEASSWRSTVQTALPAELIESYLPIEVVDALLGLAPRQRYQTKVSLPEPDGSMQDYLVVGGYCTPETPNETCNLMVVKPGDRLPDLDAVATPVFAAEGVRIITGRDPVFASDAFLGAADGDMFTPDRNLPNVQWARMRTGWIQDALFEVRRHMTASAISAGPR